MYLKIRKLPENTDVMIFISRTNTIFQLKQKVLKYMGIDLDHQTLYFHGKKLVDQELIFNYGIKINDVIQLVVKEPKLQAPECEPSEEVSTVDTTNATDTDQTEVQCSSSYYLTKDLVEYKDSDTGVWHEAVITGIVKCDPFKSDTITINLEPEISYKIKLVQEEYLDLFGVSFIEIRPRSFYKYKPSELRPGLKVLANYNFDKPADIGQWYDFLIKEVKRTTLAGNILADECAIHDCTVNIGNVFKIESPSLLADRKFKEIPKDIPRKKTTFTCIHCKDDNDRICKECSCCRCGGKHSMDTLLLCDQCDMGYHMACLDPPLAVIPPGDWYCPECKTDENEIVKPGEKTKFSKKKAKMRSASGNTMKRDWGSGMGCVGRTKTSNIVPKNHFGAVPKVEVGTTWRFRAQVSETEVHRPIVAGIHGRAEEGAYSIVLRGTYEDDIDHGDSFLYTGSGGRDLKQGNKRTAPQSKDQQLTGCNKALAMNCNVKFNDKVGAEAEKWKAGLPIRVVRGSDKRRKSKYAPKVGFRYDGIYKVVKYYPEKGKSGFLVWRYLLRRDDPNPAPWTARGRELPIIYPPGFLQAMEIKKKEKEESRKLSGKKNKKVLAETSKSSKNNAPVCTVTSGAYSGSIVAPSAAKKLKTESYKPSRRIEQLMAADSINSKLWQECNDAAADGKVAFLNKVTELFTCIVCQEILYKPITMECQHSICTPCLERSFKTGMYTCPWCRSSLAKDYAMNVNANLYKMLLDLFPGYQKGR